MVWGLSSWCPAYVTDQRVWTSKIIEVGEAVGFSWHCALEQHLSYYWKFLFLPCGWRCKWLFCGLGLLMRWWGGHSVVQRVPWAPVTLCARHWGSRVGEWETRNTPPQHHQRTWLLLTCPARPCSRDLPNVSPSLETSFSALGSHLFGIWNVVFWFWVKPQEKDFYFWNAHFQFYIPLDGIRFSGIGVSTNGILSHVSSLAVEMCCFIWGWCLVGQQHQLSLHATSLGVWGRERVLPMMARTWYLDLPLVSQ